jgi:hypothetical protein
VGLENVVSRLMAIIQPERYKNPDSEYVKILSEVYKGLDKEEFIEIISTLKDSFPVSEISKALESIMLNSEYNKEIRIRALETIYALHIERPSVVNQILTSNDTDLLQDIFDLFVRKEAILSKEQIETLLTNRSLPRHTTGFGNMVRKFIERGAPYTTEVFLPGSKYPFWEVKYDCVRTIVKIDDKDSLKVLAKFSTMSYWKARRTIIDYIRNRLTQKRLDEDDIRIAKDILMQIISDGKSDEGTPTIRLARETLKNLEK